jgi:hypothetical protein
MAYCMKEEEKATSSSARGWAMEDCHQITGLETEKRDKD